jgi:trehalose/maltose transport system permease protein
MVTATSELPRATIKAAPKGTQLTREKIRAAWIFLTPMILVLLAVAAWPLVRTIWIGFTDARLSVPGSGQWIGFENYLYWLDYGGGEGEWIGLLADPTWWRAVWNTVYFTVVAVSIETVLGLIVALVLNAQFAGRGFVRAAILVPWAIPTIVSAKMWDWMLNDQFGILNDLFMTLGLISAPIAWTSSPDTAMWAVIMVDVWKTTPFMALLILAGMQMLPGDVYEAAKVDGVHPVKVFFKITLPLIKPAIMVAVIFRMLDSLRIFDLIYVLTPNNVQTVTMSVYARQHLFDFDNFAYGSAASTLLFLIIAGITIIYIYAGRVNLSGDK